MLEASAHKQLKQIIQRNSSFWPNHLTLSRLVARSLRREDRTLIQLDPACQDLWWLGLLFPLCLAGIRVVMVLSDVQRRRLENVELPRLKEEGFPLSCWEGKEPPTGNQLWLLNVYEFIDIYTNSNDLQSRQLIIPEADRFSFRLRDAMALSITQKDWERLMRAHPSSYSTLINLYEELTNYLFAHSTRITGQIRLDESTTLPIKDFIRLLSPLPSPWLELVSLQSHSWASWAELDHSSLQWTWRLEPLEPINHLAEFLEDKPFIFISATGSNTFFQNEINSAKLPLNVVATLSEPISQEPLSLFVPFRQPFPNTEIYKDHILQQSRRLILGRLGITVILLNDHQLCRQLTSQLAAEFGTRVVHETTALESNGVVSCSWQWWLNHHSQLPLPEQLIIALLPISSLEEPLTAARVAAMKRNGRDWFRDFLLPEALSLFPPALAPMRLNNGRVAILDGRLRGRSWGKQVFDVMEPWSPLHRLLPD